MINVYISRCEYQDELLLKLNMDAKEINISNGNLHSIKICLMWYIEYYHYSFPSKCMIN